MSSAQGGIVNHLVQGEQSSVSEVTTDFVVGAVAAASVGTNAAKTGSQLLLKPGAANLTQEGLDHIVVRHWFTNGAKGAGKFAEGTTEAGLKGMINTITTQSAFRANTMGRAGTIADTILVQ